MIEMTITAVSSSTLRLKWSEPDGATCWTNVYLRGDGSIVRPTDYCRKPAVATRFDRYGHPLSSWRSFDANSNAAEREAMNALLESTDCHKLLAQAEVDERKLAEEHARKRRIEALRAAFKLIGEANLGDLSEAISADWREAERASAAIHEYVR